MLPDSSTGDQSNDFRTPTWQQTCILHIGKSTPINAPLPSSYFTPLSHPRGWEPESMGRRIESQRDTPKREGRHALLAVSNNCQQQIPAAGQSDGRIGTVRTLIAAKQDGRAAGLWDLDATGLVPRPVGTVRHQILGGMMGKRERPVNWLYPALQVGREAEGSVAACRLVHPGWQAGRHPR